MGEESLIELQNTLIATVSHIPVHTQYVPPREKNTHTVPSPECSCRAIIIKHSCICVQTIPQLLALILYMHRSAEKSQVDPRASVSPPRP